MDVKAIPLSKVEVSFLKYEPTLHDIIQTNKSTPDRMVVSDVDYLTILWILVTEEQKMHMYDIIRLKFSYFLGDLTVFNVSTVISNWLYSR